MELKGLRDFGQAERLRRGRSCHICKLECCENRDW